MGLAMDSPILPDRTGAEEDKDRRPVQPRYVPRPEVLRVIAGVIALIGAIVGLVTRLETTHPGTEVQNFPEPAVVIWGDVLSKHKVCVDELRANPTSGSWRCISPVPLNDNPKYPEIARQATWQGGRCTHRLIDDSSRTWQCISTIRPSPFVLRPARQQQRDPVFFADLAQHHEDTRPPSAELCTVESRSAPTLGAWTCMAWQRLPQTPYRLVQVIDPGGPCAYRIVDEFTGVWSCRSTAPIADGR